jgi:hypothetical protein
MAHTDDEKPQVEDETQDAPEVVAHGILSEDDSFDVRCPLMMEV